MSSNPKLIILQRKLYFLRNATDARHYAQEVIQGYNSPGKRGRPAGLQDEGGPDGDAPGGREEQPGGGEDPAGARREPQLQGHQGPDAALLQRHLQDRSDALRDSAARPRHHRGPGSPGLAGGSPGRFYFIFLSST